MTRLAPASIPVPDEAGREVQVLTSDMSGTGRSIRNYDPEFLLRPYSVTVKGFSSFTFHASSRGRALADAWNSYVGAGNQIPFGDFMKIARVVNGEASPRFGEPIIVGGRKAFYVSWDTHYVQFVLPGETSYSNSHPLDVTTATGEPFAR